MVDRLSKFTKKFIDQDRPKNYLSLFGDQLIFSIPDQYQTSLLRSLHLPIIIFTADYYS